MSEVTLICTACNRLNYLKTTLESFNAKNTHPIKELIIRDDSGIEKVKQNTFELLNHLKLPYPFHLLNKGHLGQLASIDKLMSKVKTEWVFHTEEDWEFTKGGFIEKALDIWQDDFIQVWVRGKDDGIKTALPKVCNDWTKSMDKVQYTITSPTKFSFNPHLRSMKNYTPYTKIPKIHWSAEHSITQFYKHMRVGWLTEGYCRHIGINKSKGNHV